MVIVVEEEEEEAMGQFSFIIFVTLIMWPRFVCSGSNRVVSECSHPTKMELIVYWTDKKLNSKFSIII